MELPDATTPRVAPAMIGRYQTYRALILEARPKQWVKNFLLFAAPGAAGVLDSFGMLTIVVLSLVAFCLLSSGTYFFNDLVDLTSDRQHPRNRLRPLASGAVTVGAAIVSSVVLVCGGLFLATFLSWKLGVVATIYLVISVSYSLWLKQVVVLDIVAVASGFVIRAVAGGAAADVPISQWFLIVAGSGSLFLVAAKRYAEHLEFGDQAQVARLTLGQYSLAYLRYVWTLASGIAIVAYCLWAFEQSHARPGHPWYQLSIVPFVLIILRYALLVDSGQGGAPEDVVIRDRPLQLFGIIWALVYGFGVYVGR